MCLVCSARARPGLQGLGFIDRASYRNQMNGLWAHCSLLEKGVPVSPSSSQWVFLRRYCSVKFARGNYNYSDQVISVYSLLLNYISLIKAKPPPKEMGTTFISKNSLE